MKLKIKFKNEAPTVTGLYLVRTHSKSFPATYWADIEKGYAVKMNRDIETERLDIIIFSDSKETKYLRERRDNQHLPIKQNIYELKDYPDFQFALMVEEEIC